MKKGTNIIKYLIYISIVVFLLYLAFYFGVMKGYEKEREIVDDTESIINRASFSLDPAEVSIFDDGKLTLNPMVSGFYEYNIEYTVQDKNICTINDTEVTAVKEGLCIVEAKLTANNKTYSSKSIIHIEAKNKSVPLEDVSIPNGELLMGVGSSYSINITKSPNNGIIDNITYSSDNKGIAVVDKYGKVTGVDEGNTTITISVNNGKFVKKMNVYIRKNVTVSQLVTAPTNIKLENEELFLYVNQEKEIKYTLEPSNADSNLVSFSLLNDGILSIKDNKITALKAGTTKVLVTYGNKYKEISITVNENIIAINGLSMSNSGKETIKINEKYQIVAKYYPENATNGKIKYTSLTSEICSVEDNGKVKGISKGTCKISLEAYNDVQFPPKTAKNTFVLEISDEVGEDEDEETICTTVGTIKFSSDNGAINITYDKVLRASELKDAPTRITITKDNCVDQIKYCTYDYNSTNECNPTTTYVNPFALAYNGVTVIKVVPYYNGTKGVTYYRYVNLKNGVDR